MRLSATIDLFVDKLAASPDRVVPFSRYQVGKWYPFASRASYRINDPKTATAVGCLLGNLLESQVTGLTVYTERFSLRSTAKYIGELQGTGESFRTAISAFDGTTTRRLPPRRSPRSRIMRRCGLAIVSFRSSAGPLPRFID